MLDRIKTVIAIGGFALAAIGGVIAYVEFRSASADAKYKVAIRSLELVKQTESLDRDLRIAAAQTIRFPTGCRLPGNEGPELENFRRTVRGMVHGSEFSRRIGDLVEHYRNLRLCSRHGICDGNILREEICPYAVYWSETVTWLYLADGYQGFEDAYEPLVSFAISCPVEPDELYGAPCGGVTGGIWNLKEPDWLTLAKERFTLRR